MPKPQKNKNEQEIEVKINKGKTSSIAEFTSNPVPTNDEVEEFDDYVENEVKEHDIEESLSEIYHNDDGSMVDVGKLKVKKSGILSLLFRVLFFFGFLGAVGYGVYYFLYIAPSSDATAVDFSIEGKEEVVAGEEFVYTLKYANKNRVALKNIVVEVKYPDNFIILDATGSEENMRSWKFDSIPGEYSGNIKIKGKIIGPKDFTGIMLANFNYTPENFSSEFKKESSFVTKIKEVGFDFSFDYITPVLVDNPFDFSIKFKPQDLNFIKNFRISISPIEGLEFVDMKSVENVDYKIIRPGIIEVSEINMQEENIIPINMNFIDKLNDKESIKVEFLHQNENNDYYSFFEQEEEIEVIKSNLNLTLIVNGDRNNQGIDFGGTLNYSLVFSNKGESDIKDVVIMAVVDSEFVDWSTLVEKNSGLADDGSITWSKSQISDLAILEPGDEGVLDFSLDVVDPEEIFSDKKYEITSFAQFSISSSSEAVEFKNSNNKSNTIVNKINSDVGLIEQLRYFDDDNLAVGSGPLPPKIGETTSFKVYWEITNRLHELNNLVIETILPDYVTWNSKENVSVGSISYINSENKITWNVGRLPITVPKITAEFSISLTPREDDLGKIQIVTTGTEVTATDSETGAKVVIKSKPKTTKLEDDSIADIDGIITN